MRLFVTGGAGFIGSAFVRRMMERDDVEALMVFDALTYAADMARLESVRDDKRFTFFKGDIRSRRDVGNALSSLHPDIIVNFAAESHVDRSIASPSIFIETNVLGTGVLMDAALEAGVRRFHQVSTDEVYGDLPIDSDERFSEGSPLQPSSPYSASKASADLLVLSYVRTYGLDATISRCTNNYGPWQHEEKLIPLTVSRALKGECIPVYGDGSNVRDWLYVEDHCKAIDLVVRSGREGQVYNVGGHNEKTNLEIVRLTIATIRRIMDERPALRFVLKKQVKTSDGQIDTSWINDGLITFVKDRLGHDQRYAIDPSKITHELGWTPETPFETGIVKTIEWYLAHQDWVEQVTSGEYLQYYERMYGGR